MLPRIVRRIPGGALLCVSIALAATGGCGDAGEPPQPVPSVPSVPSIGAPRQLHLALPSEAGESEAAPGDLPTPAHDEGFPGELASIATETSIYDEPRWGSRRLGYLRAGAVVRRSADPVAAGARCPDGWYRVEPRGFVCVGPMAMLDVHHPVV